MFVQQVKKLLPWIIGIPLRIFSFAWPFATEVLGLLWWIGFIDSVALLRGFCFIPAYLYLIFFPNRLIFSMRGLLTAFTLIGASLGFVVSHLLFVEEVSWTLWIHACFGIAWMLGIYLVMATKPRPVPS